MKTTKYTFSLDGIDDITQRIIEKVEHKTTLLYGDMGVGKTTLIKSLLKHLGSSDDISSPTFSIVNEYNIPNHKAYHFDLYRIKTIEEALDFGIEDYLYNNNWVFIEWPQIIETLLPKKITTLHMMFKTENERLIELKY